MISEAQKRAARKWNAAHRQILAANIDRADADRIRQHAAARGESVNAFLRRAALEQMERDNAPASVPETPAPAPAPAPTATTPPKNRRRKDSPPDRSENAAQLTFIGGDE